MEEKMINIQAKPISEEGFKPYGNFYNILNPVGYSLGNFYHDKLLFPESGNMSIAISSLIVEKPDEIVIGTVEYHNFAPEVLLPMDDDVIVHVAPPSTEPIPEKTEAFIVQKGTAVCLNAGVWHYSAIPINQLIAHIMIVLPQRTYFNDCTVINYSKENQIKISME